MFGTLANVVKSQFFLAQYNISINESNQLALFEYEAFLNLAMEEKQREIDQIFSEGNEIYVSIDDEFFVEKQDVNITDSHTINIPELSKGKHLFIANLIFEGENVAIGLKEVFVE